MKQGREQDQCGDGAFQFTLSGFPSDFAVTGGLAAQFRLESSSQPVVPVERTVLDGLRDVGYSDIFGAFHVGDGAGHLEDSVVGARAQAQSAHCVLEQALAFGRKVAVLAKLSGTHLRIGIDFLTLIPFKLPAAGADNPLADHIGPLGVGSVTQVAILHRGHVDVDIDAVKQRAGNLRDVPLDLQRSAVAFARRIIKESAGARVHRRGQHKMGGKGQADGGPGDRDPALFG